MALFGLFLSFMHAMSAALKRDVLIDIPRLPF
jgi:hypothetical protein